MARKVLQHFAHVICQNFVEAPSNVDLVELAILGTGKLELDLTAGKALHNRAPIMPLPYAQKARDWISHRMEVLRISSSELSNASLVVDYAVTLQRKEPLCWLSGRFDFECVGKLLSPNREYVSKLKASREWGLSQIYEVRSPLGALADGEEP